MSRGQHPSKPGFDARPFVRSADARAFVRPTDARAFVRPTDARAFVRPTEGGAASGKSTTSDQEPPSGVVLRPEVLARIPRLAVPMSDLLTMPLDHRAGFIMSFVDGSYTTEMILDACALPREEAIAILGELAALGVIVLG
jgi:hypothetical protein